MSTSINGYTVLTPDDIEALESRLSYALGELARLENASYARYQENAHNISMLQKRINTTDLTVQKLDTRVTEQGGVLDEIGAETAKSAVAVDKVAGHVGQNVDKLKAVANLVQAQSQDEAVRRTELVKQLEQILGQANTHTAALTHAFTEMQTHLVNLAKAQKEGAERISRVIEELRDATVQVQDQSRNELLRVQDAIESLAAERSLRTQQEVDVLAGVLATQETMRQQLVLLQGTTQALAQTAETDRELQTAGANGQRRMEARMRNEEAVLAFARGHEAVALNLAGQAVGLAPDDARAQANLAVLTARSGRAEEAAAQLQQLLQTQGERADILSRLGIVQLLLRQPQAAREALEKAAALAPQDGSIWLNLGRAHYECDEVALAVRAWRRAIAIDRTLLLGDATARILVEEQSAEEA